MGPPAPHARPVRVPTAPPRARRLPCRLPVHHRPTALTGALGIARYEDQLVSRGCRSVRRSQRALDPHGNVMHPRFDNFVLLATVLVDAEVSEYRTRWTSLPAWSASCAWPPALWGPTGRGDFDLLVCVTHNYREFTGGFTDWAQTVADCDDAVGLRSLVTRQRTPRYSRAWPSGRTASPAVAWPSAPSARTSSAPTSRRPQTVHGHDAAPPAGQG